jgi:hypothetical protein
MDVKPLPGNPTTNYKEEERKKEKKFREDVGKELEKIKHDKKFEKKIRETEKQATIDDIQMEPVIHDEKPMWLVIRKRKTIPIISGRSIKQSLKEPIDPELEITFDIKKSFLWQCKKCYAIIESNPEHPLECDKEQGGCGRRSTFTCITKGINPDRWKLPHWKYIEDLSMLDVYCDLIELLKQVLVFPDEIHYKMFGLWIMSQYKWECWNAISFWIFKGLQNSGKTRALELIHELGYRAIFTSNTTFAAMCRYTHYHNATILVDEADTNLNQSTETGQEFLRFVRSSYRRGSVYTTADNEDQEEVFCYRNYGFKAFSAEKAFNVALLTRSIVINMEKDLPDYTELRYVQRRMDDIQNKLLNYRYRFGDPPDLGEDFCLKGRNREIFESMIATGMHIGLVVDDLIAFAQDHEKEEEEAMTDSEEYEILTAIKNLSESGTLLDAPEAISLSDIFTNMGWDETYGGDQKEARKAHQRIGYFMKNNGLKTKRFNRGKSLIFNDEKNQKKLKYLWKRYKV